jgi:hypothetical protein
MRHSISQLSLLLACYVFADAAFCELSNVDTLAVHSGRILGAAKACGIDGQRLKGTAELAFLTINARAASKREQEQATSIFAVAMDEGTKQVRSGQAKCAEVRSAYETIDRDLRRIR